MLAAVFVVGLTLWIECAGIAVLVHWVRASVQRGVAHLSSLHAAILMIRFATLVIVLHFLHVFFWSVFYRWCCLPSWESSFYFSASSYSTVGYGDIVLPRVWRLLARLPLFAAYFSKDPIFLTCSLLILVRTNC